MPKLPKEVAGKGADTEPKPLPITKPRREQYPPDSGGAALYRKDLKEWLAVRRETPQGYAASRLMRQNLQDT